MRRATPRLRLLRGPSDHGMAGGRGLPRLRRPAPGNQLRPPVPDPRMPRRRLPDDLEHHRPCRPARSRRPRRRGERMTQPSPRARRLAMPLARDVVRELAVQHGGCVRPVQLRRTDLGTGQTERVLVPCGNTLAAVCPSCAERKRTLRAAQCREGWHLDREPVIEPDPPDDEQRMWVEKRAEVQQWRDSAEVAGGDTGEDDGLIADLDEEITRSGIRGKVLPDRAARRPPSTRRRQDTPDLPRRKVAPRTIGKTYTSADGKT